MNQSLEIILPIVAGMFVVLVAVQLTVRHFRNKFREDIKRKFAGKRVVREAIGANFFGQSSRGLVQVRGNGALVLTTEELHFVMFAPRRELTIPLSVVTSVTTPRSHLGKTVGMRLLRVDFQSHDEKDAAAWAVVGLDDWISDLRQLLELPIGT